jgi:threonine dehydrogenase-like Zn-dependent dehydrogenase
MRGKLAGLCGSDLHVYRGHGEFDESYASLTSPFREPASMNMISLLV